MKNYELQIIYPEKEGIESIGILESRYKEIVDECDLVMFKMFRKGGQNPLKIFAEVSKIATHQNELIIIIAYCDNIMRKKIEEQEARGLFEKIFGNKDE